MRITLIVGAAICFVIGLKMVFMFIAYHIAFDLVPYLFTAVAFFPLILLAPRSSTPKKRSLFAFLGLTEMLVIAMDLCRMFVVRF